MNKAIYGAIGVIVAAIILSIVYYQTSSPMNEVIMEESVDIDKQDAVSFSNIKITRLTATSAIIEGITDKAVKCEVEYGIETFDRSATDNMMMGNMDMPHKEHKVIIMGLEPDTTYKYRFKAVYNGETFYSEVKTFTTPST